MDIKKIRLDFPMLNNKTMQGKPLVYFDNGATSLKPQCVIDAISDYYSNFTANAHRGDYDIAHKVDQTFDDVRRKVAKFINAKEREVVFTAGTSMSINMVAYGYGLKYLTENDEILITEASSPKILIILDSVTTLSKSCLFNNTITFFSLIKFIIL